MTLLLLWDILSVKHFADRIYINITGGKYIFRVKTNKTQKKQAGFFTCFFFCVFFLGFSMPALVHTDPTHSNTAICELVTSARVVSEIVHLAQHKHNGSNENIKKKQ